MAYLHKKKSHDGRNSFKEVKRVRARADGTIIYDGNAVDLTQETDVVLEPIKRKINSADTKYLTDFDRNAIAERAIAILVSGVPKRKISGMLQKEFDMKSKHIADQCINLALDKLATLDNENWNYQRNIAIERFDWLYEQAVDTKDYKLATQINNTKVEIFGLASPKRVQAQIQLLKPIEEMTNDELDQLLADPKDRSHLLEQSSDDEQDSMEDEEDVE